VLSIESAQAPSIREHTFLDEQTRLAVFVPDRERLNYAVDLLRLPRQTHMHEQAAEGNVKCVMREIETRHEELEGGRVKVVAAAVSV